jgi:hypothetical protein
LERMDRSNPLSRKREAKKLRKAGLQNPKGPGDVSLVRLQQCG